MSSTDVTAGASVSACVCAPNTLPIDNLFTDRNSPGFSAVSRNALSHVSGSSYGSLSAADFRSLVDAVVASSSFSKGQADCSRLNSQLLGHLCRLHLLNRISLADESPGHGLASCSKQRARLRRCLQKKCTSPGGQRPVGEPESPLHRTQLQSGDRLGNLFQDSPIAVKDSYQPEDVRSPSQGRISKPAFIGKEENYDVANAASQDLRLQDKISIASSIINCRQSRFARRSLSRQNSWPLQHTMLPDLTTSRRAIYERLCRSLDSLPRDRLYDGESDERADQGNWLKEDFGESRLFEGGILEDVPNQERRHGSNDRHGARKKRLREVYRNANFRRRPYDRMASLSKGTSGTDAAQSACSTSSIPASCVFACTTSAETNSRNKSSQGSCTGNSPNVFVAPSSSAGHNSNFGSDGSGNSGQQQGDGQDESEDNSSDDEDDEISSEDDEEEDEDEDDRASVVINVDDENESSLDEDALTSLSVELSNDAARTGLPFLPLGALREESMSSHLMNSLQSSLSRYIESSCASSYDLPGIDKFETNFFSSMQDVSSSEKGDPRSAAFLMKAIESGQFDFLKTFLSDSPELDIGLSTNNYFEEPKGETTALMEAANNGRYDLVKRLLAKGADVNAKSVAKNTALHFAALSGHAKVCSLLIRHGANIEDVNDNGHTPLMEAAGAGHVDVAEVLLNHGAGVNAHSNEFKESALTLACYKGHLKMVEFLLKRGADKQHKTDEMHTALMEACMDGHVEVARLLLDHDVDVNMPPDSFESPLTLAACGGHVDLVSLLIQRGANLEEINDEGYTPLMEAAREGHKAVVQILLENGADVNATTEETQETALSLACCGGSLEVVALLIKEGANPNLGGTTPLMEAAQEGQLSVVKYLLQHGADVDITSYSGDTALALACEAGHLDVASLLITAGADVNKVDSEHGRTALMRASRAGHLNVVLLLIANGAEINRTTSANDHTALSLACAFGHVHVARALIKHGARVSQKLQDNSNCLIEAARGGHAQVINMLLKHLKDCPIDDDSIMEKAVVPSCLAAEGQMGSRVCRKLSSAKEDCHPRSCAKNGSGEADVQDNDESFSTTQTSLNEKLQVRRPNKLSEKKIARELVTGINNNGNIFRALANEDSSNPSPSSGVSDRDERSDRSYSSSSRGAHTPRQHLNQITNGIVDMGAGTSLPAESDRYKSAYSGCLRGKHQLLCPNRRRSSDLSQDLTGTNVFDGELECGDIRKCRPFVVGQVPSEMPLSAAVSPTLAATVEQASQELPHRLIGTDASDYCSRLSKNGDYLSDSLEQFPGQMSIDSCTEGNGDTPLTVACMGGYEDSVLVLLSEGADLEHKDKKGHTPLMISCTAGHISIVQILVAHGADLEATVDKTRDTCLSLAASAGQTEIVAYLINAGANKEHRNASDYTPLCLAASGGFVETINVLLSAGAEINSRTNSKLGISPLMLAAMNGHFQATKLLLDLGADINAQIETNKNTALTLACYQGRCDVVGLLIERKANIEHRAKTGLTPLMEAASGGFSDVGAILIGKGADVNAAPVPSSRDTPLTIAADKGHDKFIQLLLDNNAYIDAKNKKSATALWLAASGGHFDAVQTLISRGANPDVEDARRISVLMAAFKRGHIKTVKFLVRHVRQFPSDTDCIKFITACNDKELQKRCKICMEVIMAAKDRQTQEADKAASNLLEELDLERFREESRKQAAAKKREKRKLKRQKRKQQQAAVNGPTCDAQGGEANAVENSYLSQSVDEMCVASQAVSSPGRKLSRDLLPDSPEEPTEEYPNEREFRDANNIQVDESASQGVNGIAANGSRKSRRRKRCNTSRGQKPSQALRSQSSSFPHSSKQREDQEDETSLRYQGKACNAQGRYSGHNSLTKSPSTTKMNQARTSETGDSGGRSSADEWTEVVGRQKKSQQSKDQTQRSNVTESCTLLATAAAAQATAKRTVAAPTQPAKGPSEGDFKRTNGGLTWTPRSDGQPKSGAAQNKDRAGAALTDEQSLPTQRSLSSGNAQYQTILHTLSFAPSGSNTAANDAARIPAESVATKPVSGKLPASSGNSNYKRNGTACNGQSNKSRAREESGVERIIRADNGCSGFSGSQGTVRTGRCQNKAWKSLAHTPCTTTKAVAYRSDANRDSRAAPPIADLEVFPELGSEIKCRQSKAGRWNVSRTDGPQTTVADGDRDDSAKPMVPAQPVTQVDAIPAMSSLPNGQSRSGTTLCCKPESLPISNYSGSPATVPLDNDCSATATRSLDASPSVVCLDKPAMNSDTRLETENRPGHRPGSSDLSKLLSIGATLDYDGGAFDPPNLLESRTFINKLQTSKLTSCRGADDADLACQEVEYTPFGHCAPFEQWSRVGQESKTNKLPAEISAKTKEEPHDDVRWKQDANKEGPAGEAALEKFNKAPGHKLLRTCDARNEGPMLDGYSDGKISDTGQLLNKEPNRGAKQTSELTFGGGYKFEAMPSRPLDRNQSDPALLRKQVNGVESVLMLSPFYQSDPTGSRHGPIGQQNAGLLNPAKSSRNLMSNVDTSLLKAVYSHSADGRSQSLNAIPVDHPMGMQAGNSPLQLNTAGRSKENVVEPDWEGLMNLHLNSFQNSRVGPEEGHDGRTKSMFIENVADKMPILDCMKNAATKQFGGMAPRCTGLFPNACAGPCRSLPSPNRLLPMPSFSNPCDAAAVATQSGGMFRPGWMATRQQTFHHPVDMVMPPGLHIPYGMSLPESSSIDNPPGDYNPRSLRDPNTCLDIRRQIAEFCNPVLSAGPADHHMCPAAIGQRMDCGSCNFAAPHAATYRSLSTGAVNPDELDRQQFVDPLSHQLQFKQKQPSAEEMYFSSGQDKLRQNVPPNNASFPAGPMFGWHMAANMTAAGTGVASQANDPQHTICVPPMAGMTNRQFQQNGQMFSNSPSMTAGGHVPQNGFQLLPSANVPALNNLLKSQDQSRYATSTVMAAPPSNKMAPANQPIDSGLEKLWPAAFNSCPQGANNPAQILQSLSEDDRRKLYQQLQTRQFGPMQDSLPPVCNKHQLGGHNRFNGAPTPVNAASLTGQWQLGCPSNMSPNTVPYGPIKDSCCTNGGDPRSADANHSQIMDSMVLMLMMQEQQKQFLQRAAMPTGNRAGAPQMQLNNQRAPTSVQFSSNFVNPSHAGATRPPTNVPRNHNPLLSNTTAALSNSNQYKSAFTATGRGANHLKESVGNKNAVESNANANESAAPTTDQSKLNNGALCGDQKSASPPPKTPAVGPIGCERKKQVDSSVAAGLVEDRRNKGQ